MQEFSASIHLCSFDQRLEMMFERAEQRSEELEMSYALLDRWKNKTDELLYSMIPKTVADRLRAGATPMSTCEVNFEVNKKKRKRKQNDISRQQSRH